MIEETRLHFTAVKDRRAVQASITNEINNTNTIYGNGSVTNYNWVNTFVETADEQASSPIKRWRLCTH